MTPISFSDDRTALVTGARSGIGHALAVGVTTAGTAVGCLDLVRAGFSDTVQSITPAEGARPAGQSSTAALSKRTSLASCARVVARVLGDEEALDA